MSKQFKFSDPGEGLQEAEILEVHVSAGDSVSDGDTVLTVETDKANTDIPAPFTGTIDEVSVSEGDMVEIGDVLMAYSEDGDSGENEQSESDKDEGDQDDKKDQQAEGQTQSGKQADEGGKKDKGETGDEDEDEDETSKSTKSRNEDEQDEQDEQNKDNKPSPSDNRDSEDRATEQHSGSKDEESSDRKKSDKRQPVPAAPSTRRLAREKGVDLHNVKASGPQDRVTAEDVEAAASNADEDSSQSASAKKTSPLTPGLEPAPLPDLSQWGETEREPLRSIRRATARNMARSWAEIPHVYHQDIADVTALERFRREHSGEQGKLTLTVLVMKALVGVLKQFPRFNASLDVANQEIVYKHYFHIGLAVATERGLLVPVIRDVDRKNVVELADEAVDIARKARNGELSRADMQGGAITLTNPGPLGGASLTPLINHPQVAILGMGQARLEPVAFGDLDDHRIEPRLRLPLVLGFDHRVNDGADAARFVTTLIQALDDPESLLLTV